MWVIEEELNSLSIWYNSPGVLDTIVFQSVLHSFSVVYLKGCIIRPL